MKSAFVNSAAHDSPFDLKDDISAQDQWQDAGKPTERILAVYMTLCQVGPMSLKELCDRLGLPKVSAWRAIKVLEGFSLVALRNLDSRYFVANTAIRLVQSALDGCDYTGIDIPNIFKLINGSRYGVAFGTFTGQDRFEILDSSRGMTVADVAPIGLGHGFYTAGLSAMPLPQQLKVIERQFAQIKNLDDVATIRNGLEKDLEKLGRHGFTEHSGNLCFFSARTAQGMNLAFAVEVWPRYARAPNAVKSYASEVAQILNDLGLQNIPAALLKTNGANEAFARTMVVPPLVPMPVKALNAGTEL